MVSDAAACFVEMMSDMSFDWCRDSATYLVDLGHCDGWGDLDGG